MGCGCGTISNGSSCNCNEITLPVGVKGNDGVGVVSILRTSGDGSPGTTDTYTITYTDDSTNLLYVYNGTDGDGLNGSGTNNYIAKWTPDGTTLGDSIIQCDGNTIGIGNVPLSTVKVYCNSTKNVTAAFYNSGTNSVNQGIVANTYGVGTNNVSFAASTYNGINSNIGIVLRAGVSSLPATPVNSSIGLLAEASSVTNLNYGSYISATGANSSTNVGLYSKALYGTNNYAAQLIDGTESIGKALICITNTGHANWGKITNSHTSGATGTFTSVNGKTVTVTNGLITSIL